MANFFKQSYVPYLMFLAGVILIFLWARTRMVPAKEGFEDGGKEADYITASPWKFNMYYVDWCPHCKTAKPEFAKLGAIQTIAGKKVECNAIEADKNPEKVLGKVNGYPTIQLYNAEGEMVDEYSGPRTSQAFQSYLEDIMNRP